MARGSEFTAPLDAAPDGEAKRTEAKRTPGAAGATPPPPAATPA